MLQRINIDRTRLITALVVITLLGLVFRGVGLSREPIWIDEACSADFCSGPVSRVLAVNARDSHPPAYYLALKGWRALFGDSPAGLRSFSVVWSVLGLLWVAVLAAEISGSNRVAAIAATFLALHPLDIWFAQEARMYSLLSVLGVASSLFLWLWLGQRPEGKRLLWLVLYGLTATLALYTHYVFVFLIFSQGAVSTIRLVILRDHRGLMWFSGAIVACSLLFTPWLTYLEHVNANLYNSTNLAWIPMPQVSDLAALYGFTLMGKTGQLLPLLGVVVNGCVVIVFVAVLMAGSVSLVSLPCNRWPLAFVIFLATAPAVFSFLVSVVYRPVFFAPRIGVLILPYYVVFLAMAMVLVRPLLIRWAIVTLAILVMVTSTIHQTLEVSKRGLGEFAEFYAENTPPDFLVFFPAHNAKLASYYLKMNRKQPTREHIEAALRLNGPTRIWVLSGEKGPPRSHPDLAGFEFNEWLLSLGPDRKLAEVDGLALVEVTAQPIAKEYPALPPGGRVDFGSASSVQYLWNGWYQSEGSFRWSKGNSAAVVFSQLDERADVLRVRLSCFRSQRITIEMNGYHIDEFICDDRSRHTREFDLNGASAKGPNTLTFLLPDATAPATVSDSRDRRVLAIAVEWLELE